MQYSTITLAAISALLSTAVAAPASARSTCTMVAPSSEEFLISAAGESTVLDFTIGATTPGPCTLVARVGAGYTRLHQSGNPQLDVFALNGNAPGAMVGTVALDPVHGQYTTINSFQCQDTLSFEFSIADTGKPGSVSFATDGYNGIFVRVGDC